MYRLVALDVDGTLLTSDHRLAPETVTAIHAAQDHGAYICLATGKLLESVVPLVRELRLRGPQITCNGAAVMDASSRRSLGVWPLPSQLIERALTAVRSFAPDLPIAWYTTDTIFSDAPVGLLDATLAAYHEPPVRHVPHLSSGLAPATKLLMTGDHARLLALRDHLQGEIGSEATITRTTAEFVEVMAPGVDKGTALTRLATDLGIAHDQVVAIGDGENDIPLLRAAGLRVAMGNSMAGLLAVAQWTAPSNDEGGVAATLARLGLV